MDMDSDFVAEMRGRCRVCLESDVDVVALSLTVCVFAKDTTLSQMLKTCCAIEISASDRKPHTLCNYCAKTAKQLFIFRKICQNADIALQKELDGVNMKIESDEHMMTNEDQEEDDHKTGTMVPIMDGIPDCASIAYNDDLKQLKFENTNSIEKIVCKICQTYFSDWISLERHLGNCYRRVCGVCGETFTSSEALDEHTRTHETSNTYTEIILKDRKKVELYKCRFCKMSYKFPAELKYHLTTHTTVKHHLCSYCGNNFSLSHRSKCETTQSQHGQTHINKKSGRKTRGSLKTQPRFGCSVCKKSYRRQETLMNHKCIHTDEKPHKCPQCSMAFAFISFLRTHMRTHSGEKPYECSICNKRFSQRSQVNRHKLTHSGEKPYECSHCSKRFTRQESLRLHELSHSGKKPYKCSHCTKSYAVQYYLTKHERIHTGENTHDCSYCSKRFTKKSYLTRHVRIHTGEKPYECSHCDKRFTLESHLKSHKVAHSETKSYECSYCSKLYLHKNSLQIHERTHTGEKPFECSLCNRRFAGQSTLKTHIRTHTGEKPYGCSNCSKRFANKSNLTKHERIHISEKPYKCSHCNKCFAHRSLVDRHQRNTHTHKKCE